MQLRSGIELLMDVTNKQKVIESLEKNEVDFALVSLLPNTIKVEQLELLQNKLYLVGDTKKQLVQDKSVKSFFEDLPMIFREKGSGTRQAMEGFLENNHISVLKKMELTSNEAVKQALLAGLGYSIMPVIGIKNELLQKQLQLIAVEGLPIETTWRLIWLSGKKHTPVASSFLSYLKTEKEKIVASQFKWYEQY